MEQKHHWLIGSIAILGILIISGCVQQTKNSDITSTQANRCKELAKNLDENIIDTNNPPGRFAISGFEGIVGGTLINISEPWDYVGSEKEQGSTTYTLTFKGIDETGDLILITSPDTALHYEVGAFYTFDLKNKNQFSMQLSGAFMDPNLDALEHLQECV